MTAEEMGAALGPGWRFAEGWRDEPGSWQWWPKGLEGPGIVVDLGVDPHEGTVDVSHSDTTGNGNVMQVPVRRAVAVARLLVAVERIAGGAEVEPHPDHWATWSAAFGAILPVPGYRSPAQARALALDLLAAADEAEAQP